MDYSAHTISFRKNSHFYDDILPYHTYFVQYSNCTLYDKYLFIFGVYDI